MLARLLDKDNTRILVRTSRGDVCCLQCSEAYGQDVIKVGYPYTQHQYTTNRLLPDRTPERYSYCLCAVHCPYRPETPQEKNQPSQEMQRIVMHDQIKREVYATVPTQMVPKIAIPSRLHNAFYRLQRGLNFGKH